MNAKQKGFTLVEIAIVLVIIGLLLGGILKGQEMITQAKVKNVMADFSGVSAAYHGYQDRYRMIPGDDNGAIARWTLGAGLQGNGDGVVAGTYNSSTANDESRLFWLHLRQAGFVSGTGQEPPFNAVTGRLGVQTGNGVTGAGARPIMGQDANGAGGFSGLVMCSANLPDKIAIAVDTQMDDGKVETGTVRAQLQNAPNPAASLDISAEAEYAETGSNTYLLCRSL